MQNNSHIKNKVEAALNSVEGVQRATPKPFFYTRLLARLDTRPETGWERFSAFISRPVVAFACVCLVIVINAVIVFSDTTSSFSSSDKTELAVADEYTDVATSSLYDLENSKP